MWNIRVWLILFDNVDINIVEVVFDSSIEGKITALGVIKGAVWEGIMGGTTYYTIKLEGYDGEGVCAVYGGLVGCIQGVECIGAWENERDQAHTVSREGGDARNLNRSVLNK